MLKNYQNFVKRHVWRNFGNFQEKYLEAATTAGLDTLQRPPSGKGHSIAKS